MSFALTDLARNALPRVGCTSIPSSNTSIACPDAQPMRLSQFTHSCSKVKSGCGNLTVRLQWNVMSVVSPRHMTLCRSISMQCSKEKGHQRSHPNSFHWSTYRNAPPFFLSLSCQNCCYSILSEKLVVWISWQIRKRTPHLKPITYYTVELVEDCYLSIKTPALPERNRRSIESSQVVFGYSYVCISEKLAIWEVDQPSRVVHWTRSCQALSSEGLDSPTYELVRLGRALNAYFSYFMALCAGPNFFAVSIFHILPYYRYLLPYYIQVKACYCLPISH